MSDNEVQTIKLSRLVPDPENVNQHNEINLQQIAASIDRFGFLDPIGVVKMPARRGYYMIVEGHGRFDAAHMLSLEEVPCLVLTLDEAHRRGYAISHNQTQQISIMDHRAVAMEFERLDVSADDYPSLGYTQEDVLFLPGMDAGVAPSHFPAGEAAEIGTVETEGEGAETKNAATGFVPTVYRTGLTFSTDQSYNRFVHILTALRGRYPTAATIGERLVLLLGDMGVSIPAEGDAA